MRVCVSGVALAVTVLVMRERRRRLSVVTPAETVGREMSYYHYQQCNDMSYYTPHTQEHHLTPLSDIILTIFIGYVVICCRPRNPQERQLFRVWTDA